MDTAEPRPIETNTGADSLFSRGVNLLLRYPTYFILVSFVGAVAGFAMSFLVTPVFRAEAILVPSDEMLGLNQNSQIPGLGGIASLIGVGGGGSKQNEALAILKSRSLTYAFIRANSLLPILFHDQWNSTTSTWTSPGKSPTIEDGYNVFDRNIRSVVENRKNGLITIAVTWEDPKIAKQWTDGLVNATNNLIRHQAIDRSTKNLEYLQSAAEKTSVMEVKATLYKLMEAEIKKQMAALGNDDYAFRVVDPAVVPERKSAPKRSEYAAFGGVFCGIVCFLIIMFRHRVKLENLTR